MPPERYYLIYQEASDEECLLTIQPYDDEELLAEAINRLQTRQVDEYTIIKGRKMKAKLRLAVELSEAEDKAAAPPPQLADESDV